MAKRRQKIDNRQMSLIDYLEQVQTQKRVEREARHVGRLNVRESLRISLVCAIKNCKLSRHQIAGEMSHLLGVEITKTTIDAWTAESKPQHRFPAEYLPAFCRATGCTEPLEVIGEAAGIFALPGPDALRAEIQKYSEQERAARSERRRREMFLKELEHGKVKKGRLF